MSEKIVTAEVVSEKVPKDILFFGIGQSQQGRWVALGDFESEHKASLYMRGETSYGNIKIVRVNLSDSSTAAPAKGEVDWKGLAKKLATIVRGYNSSLEMNDPYGRGLLLEEATELAGDILDNEGIAE